MHSRHGYSSAYYSSEEKCVDDKALALVSLQAEDGQSTGSVEVVSVIIHY